jgi:transposase
MADTDGTTKKKTSRRPFWQQHLRAWSQSGLTQADYCRQHELSRAAFGWWKRQLQGKPKPRKESRGSKRPQRDRQTAVQFVEVQRGPDVGTSTNAAVYEVLLPHGRAVRVGHDFDPDVLKRLIATVEASC